VISEGRKAPVYVGRCVTFRPSKFEGLRRLEPRIVAVIYSIDPAIAALIGFLALGERLAPLQIVALAAVMIASAGATAAAGNTDA
jgi:threonine/homoserine efflux transporter RhtA